MSGIALHDADDTLGDRVISAALRCVAQRGLAKTNLEAVACEAGCSRASVYRAFPGGRDALLRAVGDRELTRIEGAVAVAVASAETLEDALVAAIVAIARHLEAHDAFEFLLTNEPGAVLPHLAFRELDHLLARARVVGGPLLERHLASDVAAATAEWVVRLVVSHICAPSAGAPLTDPLSVHRLVEAFVLPGLLVPSP